VPWFISKKFFAVRLGGEDDEMENLFSNFNILLTIPFQRNENLFEMFSWFFFLSLFLYHFSFII